MKRFIKIYYCTFALFSINILILAYAQLLHENPYMLEKYKKYA